MTRSRAILTIPLLVVLAAAWIVFAPMQFGGQAAYVIVAGNSMEPYYYRGDLVILRQATTYQIGEVLTYQHPEIGPVIHRLIGRESQHYVFQGDNNSWIDPYRPVAGELIGKEWIHLPGVGTLIEPLRTPRNMAILCGLTGLLFASGITREGRQRSRRGQRRKQQEKRQPMMNDTNYGKEGLWSILGGLALASLLLGILSFTRPTERAASQELLYQQTGEFGYAAAAPAGIYDAAAAHTGDPIFRRVTNQVTFRFNYQLVAQNELSVSEGTAGLLAEIGTESGWRRTIALQPATPFDGDSTSVEGTLDLGKVEALIQGFEDRTGVEHQEYRLAIVPQVAITGTLAGETLNDRFTPRLELKLDELQLQLASSAAPAGNPLKPAQQGLLQTSSSEPNTISLLGIELKVTSARILATAGLVLTVVLLISAAAPLLSRKDEASRIRAKYGPLLVDVQGLVLQEGDRIVTMATIADLARLAQRDGHMILHASLGSYHSYLVQGNGVTYAFEVLSAAADHPATEHINARLKRLSTPGA